MLGPGNVYGESLSFPQVDWAKEQEVMQTFQILSSNLKSFSFFKYLDFTKSTSIEYISGTLAVI